MTTVVTGAVVTSYSPGPPPHAEIHDPGPPPKDVGLDELSGEEGLFELAFTQGGTLDLKYDTTSTGLNVVEPGSVTYHPPS